MSNGIPENLQLKHLLFAAAPEQKAGQTAVSLQSHYTKRIEAIDQRLVLTEHWRDRIVIRPIPPQPKTLAELVETARRRLREDRLRDDRDELQARRFVLQKVATELQR